MKIICSPLAHYGGGGERKGEDARGGEGERERERERERVGDP